MNVSAKQIIIDCERMKYPNTGLFYYCKHLVMALWQVAFANENIDIYAPKSAKNLLTDGQLIEQNSLHKFVMPSAIKKASVWHATYQGTNYFPSYSKMPIVLTIHDLNFLQDDKKNTAKKQRYLSELQQKVNRANYITAISNYTLTQLLSYIDVANKPTKVIYNGCNINPMVISKPQHIPKKPFLFTIGTITDKKNFHVLPCLLVDNDLCLVIAGITQSEAYKKQIVDEAQKWHVADRVIFVGEISENDKQWYYQNCYAFVFPSLAEGFGLPVIEAMHFGTLTILSSLTSLPEIGGSAAYYFTSFEPDAMQETLKKSCVHFYGNNIQKTLVQQRSAEFTWHNAAQQYLEVYRTLY